MANVKLIFCGDDESQCYNRTLELYVNHKSKLYLCITDMEDDHDISSFQFTVFDKPTAIKLSKELKKQIALMD